MLQSYLVTGGAGFIGSMLCDRLIGAGHRVIVFDNFSSGRRANLGKAAAVAKPGQLTVHKGDIRSILDYVEAIGEVDIIVHLAALISGYDSLKDAASYVDVNVNGLLRVIDFAAARKAQRIVFASSSTVYGDSPLEVLNENAPPSPLTVYAVTKLTGEHLLSLYGKMHGFSHCSLRLFNVYGPRQAVNHPYANVTCKFSHAAANGFSVRRYGDGEQSRDFVYVENVVDAFAAVMNSSAQTIYNVGTGVECSINSLMEMLGRITDNPLKFEQHPAWPNDIRRIRADISRMEREFSFRPVFGIESGLRATVDFFRAQPSDAAGR